MLNADLIERFVADLPPMSVKRVKKHRFILANISKWWLKKSFEAASKKDVKELWATIDGWDNEEYGPYEDWRRQKRCWRLENRLVPRPNHRYVLFGIRRVSCEIDLMLEFLCPPPETPQSDLEQERERLKERSRAELLVVKREFTEAALRIARYAG